MADTDIKDSNDISLYLRNKELNEAEFKDKKISLDSKPLNLRAILTNRCNIDCIMCDYETRKDKFTIPYEKIRKIIDLFPYLERIDWQGGEVFMVDYFKEMLEQASQYPHILQTIQTNGLLVNEKWADLLVKHNVILLFSIDGATKRTYEYIRRGARFENLLKNISIFNEYSAKYDSTAKKFLCVCTMRSNYMELEEFIEFAIKYDFKQVSFGAIHGTDAFNENIFTPGDPQAIKYLKEKMPGIEKICKEKGIILKYYFKPCLTDETDDLTKNHCENNGRDIKCKLPWTNLCIDAIRGGGVYPECLCSKSVGNIMRDNLLDIWNALLIQQYRSAIANNNFSHICSEYCLQFK